MTFLKDTRGALAYRLSADERVDQDALGMLRNNEVEHIVPVTFKQFDDNRELHFATEGLHDARTFFAQHAFNRQQFVEVLTGVVDAFAEGEEYMLSEESFAGSLDTAFIDDRLSMSLVYLPVVGYRGCADARSFLQEIRRSLEADRSSGDLSYLLAIDGALGDADGFSVGEFKKLLASLTLKPKRGGSPGLEAGQGFAPIEAAPPNTPGVQQGASGGFDAGAQGVAAASPATISHDAGIGASLSGPSDAAGAGMAIPGSGGAPASFGGMMIPGGGQAIPGGDANEKKGLFGLGGKGKDSTGKAGRAEKKRAKAAEKAGKKRKKGGKSFEDGAEKTGGLFSLGKGKDKKRDKKDKGREMVVPMGPPRDEGAPLPFPVPGSEGQATQPTQVDPAGSAVAGGAPVQGVPGGPGYDSYGQPTAPTQAGQAAPTQWGGAPAAAPSGDRYSDNDFGITQVYGIGPVAKDGAAGQAPRQDGFAQAPQAPQGLPVTAYLYRESTGEKRLIDKTPFRIGRRRSEVDFHIAEKPKVSRVHAVVVFDGERFAIRDNKSVNHTMVNGRVLDPDVSVALVDGDRIGMGDESFRFMMG